MKKLSKIFLIDDSTTLFSPILSTDCETKTTVRWIGHGAYIYFLSKKGVIYFI